MMQTFEKSVGSVVLSGLPPNVEDVLSEVAYHLDQGEPTKALAFIRKRRIGSPWVVNATGVCHLRRGDPERAVEVFRGLVIGAGGIQLRPDSPTTFKANFAAALFAAGNVPGCLAALAEIRVDEHPAVDGVRRAVARWRDGLSFWQKVGTHLGSEPPVTLPPDTILGALWP
jgi:hypothetical protein